MLNRRGSREYNKTEEKSSPNQPIQTKVTYQYPKKAPFRFPVIPDNVEQERKTDIPTYQRRTRRRRNEESHQEEIIKKEKVIQTNEKKFVPTEVPSPIYGYQKRKKAKTIEDIPAFVRNKQQPKEVQLEESEQQIVEEIRREQPQDHADKLPDVSRNIQQEDQQEEEPIISVNNRSKQSVKKQTKNKQNKRKNRHKQSKQQEHVPFNVMMSHNDNQYLAKNSQTKKDHSKKYKQNSDNYNQQSKAFPAHLLNDPAAKSNDDKIWVQNQQELLEQTLKHFNVKAKVVNATQGPSVTRFEVQPELGVKVSRVRNLNDDIKLNMSAKDIRIEAPIPGKNTIGIEVPNVKPQMVGLQEIFAADAFKQSKSPLTIGLGLTVEGDPLVTNISKMPHGLIAGATGSGKSVCINTILMSLLYKSNHEDVKMLLIDPKMVELAPYNGIPHLVSPVITDVKAATAALKWAVNEMEERYDRFVKESVRDIERYNEKVVKQGRPEEKMPFMVIVIDELADLMMASPQDVEDSICRIAQKARACGMHLLLATQRPSVDVITGLIKANIPTRIAFSVSSQIDSRTIIDTNGAERLLGKGDMLFMENGSGKSLRLQGAFVSDEEIDRVTNHARTIAKPNYLFEQEQLLKQIETAEDKDELLEDVIEFVLNQNHASTSLLQRQFRIGYNRAARLIDSLENKGIISGQNGSKPRDVLISKAQLDELHYI